MTTWLRDHGLLLTNVALFLAFLVGLAITGWHVANQDLLDHGELAETFGQYLAGPHFYEAVFENWESEFLQMGAYVVLTVFLFQRGSSESKDPDGPNPQDEDPRRHRSDPNAPWPVRRGGLVLKVYENSLLILFVVLFVASFVLHLVTGAAEYSQDQTLHAAPPVSPLEYLGTSQFWFESFQNWQSEFMVIAVLIGAAIFLRQRGSGESKPVATPHDSTS